MPRKVSVKAILELRAKYAKGISMRKIENLLHISRHTISNVYKCIKVLNDGAFFYI